jgi:hypothetical protein
LLQTTEFARRLGRILGLLPVPRTGPDRELGLAQTKTREAEMIELIGFLIVLFLAALISAYIVGLILLAPLLITAGVVWLWSKWSKLVGG